jgi:hypothetical protein
MPVPRHAPMPEQKPMLASRWVVPLQGTRHTKAVVIDLVCGLWIDPLSDEDAPVWSVGSVRGVYVVQLLAAI